ncbi:MAG: cytochrome c3 family protein [Bacteriovoracaceae bacterium]
MFTFRLEPQVIHIHDARTLVVQENCISCHSSLAQNENKRFVTLDTQKHGGGKLCWECHRDTPHGRVNCLASVLNARVPIPSEVTPTWLNKFLGKDYFHRPHASPPPPCKGEGNHSLSLKGQCCQGEKNLAQSSNFSLPPTSPPTL